MTDFGRDISCTDSLRPGRFATGVQLVAEAVYRRLTTPRGMLRGGEDEANYGLDLADLIGSVTTKSDIAALSGRIRAELLKDERIISADATVTDVSVGVSKAFDIRIDVETRDGPFALTIGVTEVTTQLLGIEEGT